MVGLLGIFSLYVKTIDGCVVTGDVVHDPSDNRSFYMQQRRVTFEKSNTNPNDRWILKQ